MATPSTVIAPCTARKSTARGRRQDTRWMATAPLTVRMVAITPPPAGTTAGAPRTTVRSRGRSPATLPPERRPRELRDAAHVVEAEHGGDDRAHHDTDDRRPEAQRPARRQRDAGDDHHRQRRAQRRRRRRGSLRHRRKQVERGGHHRDRYQHDHRSRDGRREHPLEQRKPRGQHERNDGRDEDQGREQRRTAGRDGGDADRDVGRRGCDHDQVARADPPGPDRLQYRGYSADRDGGEHRPRQIGLARTRRPHHDRRDQDDGGKGEHGNLKAETERERRRRLLVRLIPQSAAAAGPAGVHEALPGRAREGHGPSTALPILTGPQQAVRLDVNRMSVTHHCQSVARNTGGRTRARRATRSRRCGRAMTVSPDDANVHRSPQPVEARESFSCPNRLALFW